MKIKVTRMIKFTSGSMTEEVIADMLDTENTEDLLELINLGRNYNDSIYIERLKEKNF